MKTLRTLFVIAIAIIGFTTKSNAQEGDTKGLNASARVIEPIQLSSMVTLNFGSFAADADGTITISTAGGRSKTGSLTLSSIDPGAKGSFNVKGQADCAYDINLPDNNVTIANGEATMAITDWKANSAQDGNDNDAVTGKLDGDGNDVLSIGATLHVVQGKAVGTYTGTFNVTVNYN